MPTYAAETSVPVEKSRMELERTLQRYKASHFMYGTEPGRALVMFQIENRRVRFHLDLPKITDYATSPAGRKRRSPAQQEAAWEQACRQRWRALNLVVKAKLEAVEAEIASFEEEFMAWLVLPNGTTVGETLIPDLARGLDTGEFPALMPGPMS